MKDQKYTYNRIPVAEYSLVFFAILAGFLANWTNFKILAFIAVVWFIIKPPSSRKMLQWGLLILVLVSFAIGLRQLDRANELLGIFYLLLVGALFKLLDEKPS